MIIENIDVILDGGTVLIKTNKGTYFMDNRIDTQTRYTLYDNYPEIGGIIENQKKIKEEIYKTLDNYSGEYSPGLIQMIMEDLKK